MNNEIKVLNKADRMNRVKALESAGFPSLRSGLGVDDGMCQFFTPDDENIYATKAITIAKDNFGLTLVAGILKGAEPHNRDVNNSYGLTATNKQFVITCDHFMIIEPNQSYEVGVLNGRAKFTLAEADDIIDTSEVITRSKKQKVAVEK
ncbi:hypothetical protein AQ505_08815 [Pedobacter sp. PACM 27299]|uniref:hypothetical protein n=1 Tax=Pedobacter sp. PACM 27299 TaxID=1727164 RepID=UPI000705B0B3|nr:hypothetical protein [Pedobacter sp. PACM 27299]ALL05583.1 hypothetical protein AQ505_08815 [Pedobacter sp. PACM 27299]